MLITNTSQTAPGVYQVTVMHEGVYETFKIKPGFSSVSQHHLQRVAYHQMHIHLKARNEAMQTKATEARAARAAEEEAKKDPPTPTPTMGNTKHEIQAYMKDHGIKYGTNDKKKRLLRLISEYV